MSLSAHAAALITAADLLLLVPALGILLRRAGFTLAEAGAGASIGVLLLLSLPIRAAHELGLPALVPAAQCALLGAAALVLGRYRRRLHRAAAALKAFVRAEPPAAAALLLALAMLAALIGGRPGGAGGASGPAADPSSQQLLLGFFRRLPAIGALPGWFAYLAVGPATYALARRYAWPTTAATATLVVLSQPRLICQALGGGGEALSAAAGLWCLLLVYRTVEDPDPLNLALLVLGLAFAVSSRPLGLGFPAVLAASAVVVLYRRHGARRWWSIIGRRPAAAAGVAAAALVLAQPWRWRLPAAGGYPLNDSAILGAGGNLLRYLLQSMDPPPAAQWLFHRLFGVHPAELVQGAYDALAAPLLGQRGAAAAFTLGWGPDPGAAWFGPLGFLLVLPAVGYALIRGPRRLRSVALALLAYVYLAALVPAWLPGNATLFTPFFACGGFMVAFMLPPWRLTGRGQRGLQGLCLLLWCHALVVCGAFRG